MEEHDFELSPDELAQGDDLYELDKDNREYRKTSVKSAEKRGYSTKIEVEDGKRTYSDGDFRHESGDFAHVVGPDEVDSAVGAIEEDTGIEFSTSGGLSDVHEDRSEHSQSLDESLKAPIADSKEQWRNNPDQYDWPGIDTPD